MPWSGVGPADDQVGYSALSALAAAVEVNDERTAQGLSGRSRLAMRRALAVDSNAIPADWLQQYAMEAAASGIEAPCKVPE